MPINEWWAEDPSERFWLEITDRETLGRDLFSPQLAESGKETWSYSLVSHVRPGDVVFHYWKQPGQDKAIVGFSFVTGALETTTIRWQSHGTYGKAGSGRQKSRPAWRFPLTDFTDLTNPVTLEDLRAMEAQLRALTSTLESEKSGPLYLPFAFSDKRPLRTAQGYLTKMPTAYVEGIPGLAQALEVPRQDSESSPTSGPASKGSASGTGYLQDQALKLALERHAVEWTMQYFAGEGYDVQDVGSTHPFDVLAIYGDDELHVEVKGSSGTSTTVELTSGEMAEAQPNTRYGSVLVVVDKIDWAKSPDGTITVNGDRIRIWTNWSPEDERLVPTKYRYLLPPENLASE